jgi:hypothetical protein
MARKRSEARSIVSPESAAAAATRRRPSHVKAAQHAEPERETTTIEPSVRASTEAAASLAPIAEREEIARLAYSYWEARGGQGGSPEEDWVRAEQEFRVRRQASAN